MHSRFTFVLTLLLALAATAAAQEIRVAAAADLQFALNDLAGQYEKQAGAKLALSFGSSGNFFAQIQNGAPFDIYFSADREYPEKLQAAGFTEPGTLEVYAQGHLVVWTPPGSSYGFPKRGLAALLDPAIQKIAIANPEHAPYGRAAAAALKKAGLYDQLQSKLVFGENISQTAQFVQSGNAQVGLLALSLALSPAMQSGERWPVPADLYPPLEQAVVILKSASDKAAAKSFLAFLHSPAARATLERYGFRVPAEAAAKARP